MSLTRNLYCRLKAICKLIVYGVLHAIAYAWSRDTNSIVMGGWAGDLYIDNPKYLLNYLLEHTCLEITWIGNNTVKGLLPIDGKLTFARKGSFLAFWRLLNANTWICCQSICADLTPLPILGRAKAIDLWHGIPIKNIGKLSPGFRKDGTKSTILGRVYQTIVSNPPAWLVVSNEKMIDILCGGAPDRYTRSKILRVGTPRNDFLINNVNNTSLISFLRKKYSELLGIDISKKIVLYLPTWRMCGDVFAFYKLSGEDQGEWKRVLDSFNAVIVEKHHYGTYAKYPLLEGSKCSIAISAELQKAVDVQELLLVADILISDYSGAYIDFGLLKKPVVHFAYDLNQYCTVDSGLAYDLKDIAAGTIVSTSNELMTRIKEILITPKFLPAKSFHELVEYEKGCSSIKLCNFIAEG